MCINLKNACLNINKESWIIIVLKIEIEEKLHENRRDQLDDSRVFEKHRSLR